MRGSLMRHNVQRLISLIEYHRNIHFFEVWRKNLTIFLKNKKRWTVMTFWVNLPGLFLILLFECCLNYQVNFCDFLVKCFCRGQSSGKKTVKEIQSNFIEIFDRDVVKKDSR